MTHDKLRIVIEGRAGGVHIDGGKEAGAGGASPRESADQSPKTETIGSRDTNSPVKTAPEDWWKVYASGREVFNANDDLLFVCATHSDACDAVKAHNRAQQTDVEKGKESVPDWSVFNNGAMGFFTEPDVVCGSIQIAPGKSLGMMPLKICHDVVDAHQDSIKGYEELYRKLAESTARLQTDWGKLLPLLWRWLDLPDKPPVSSIRTDGERTFFERAGMDAWQFRYDQLRKDTKEVLDEIALS
jgi:hypothetical protein